MRILLRTLRELLALFGCCAVIVCVLWCGWIITLLLLFLVAIIRCMLGIQ